jgi:cytidyltransferase-like protein
VTSQDTARVAVTGAFDDIRSRDIRFLQEAARLGPLHILLWDDQAVAAATGKPPKFPHAERRYLLEAVRYVHAVHLVGAGFAAETLPCTPDLKPTVWAGPPQDDTPARRAFCKRYDLDYHVVTEADLAGFPAHTPETPPRPAGTKKVLVTGCYDWFHSGHVRFFEECSELGDLYVVVGHDTNVRELKGEPHPMFSQDERCYVVGSIRYVTQALISTGHGWMDAEPEVQRIKPDIYAVNEDGDRPIKREFCAKHGLEYVVLKRLPKRGLPRRESTHLRGF